MWVTKTSQILLGEENTAGGGASAEWPLRTDSLAQSIRKTRIRGTEGRTGRELDGVGGSPSGGELEGVCRDRPTTAQILDFVRRQEHGQSPAWRGQMSSSVSRLLWGIFQCLGWLLGEPDQNDILSSK